MKPKVLIIDDNRDILTTLRILLSTKYDVKLEDEPKNIPVLLRKEKFSTIILDMNFTEGAIKGEEGYYWLNIIKEIDPLVSVILITAYGSIDSAVRGIKLGATDFVVKPWSNEKLLTTLSVATTLNLERVNNNLLKEQNRILSNNFPEIIGESKVMLELFETINSVAQTDVNVLITGENGTGKELIARAIHNKSNRQHDIFIGVDMGSIPESLFESELFGYQKGAFTGAESNRVGRVEAANSGTLFFDEIGNIPLNLQSKLLRVLETREIVPLGSRGKRNIDIRLISATNSDILDLVSKGEFRQDLLYRINTIEIKLPPLRERLEDVDLIVDHHLRRFKKRYNKPDLSIDKNSIKKLKSYSWPGNIRELINCLERSVILSKNNFLKVELPQDKVENSTSNFNLKDMEKKVISEVIELVSGNLSRAAEKLGITRATLYKKIEKYDL